MVSQPDELELIRRDYVANGGWETFLSYEDPERDILVGLLRLRKCSVEGTFREELLKDGQSSMVRELHGELRSPPHTLLKVTNNLSPDLPSLRNGRTHARSRPYSVPAPGHWYTLDGGSREDRSRRTRESEASRHLGYWSAQLLYVEPR